MIGYKPSQLSNGTAVPASKPNTESNAKDESPLPWHTLISYSDLPHWQQDNAHIHAGYRQASYSYLRSITSMAYWHNESVNIWTHFLPGLLSAPFAYWLYTALKPRYEAADAADVYAMACFFVGAGSGMLLSGIYHTLSNHSPNVARFWNQLDYVGIALMIWGSFVPSVYYGFWCDGMLRQVYWCMISVFGLGCVIVTMLPAFRTPAWRPYRAALFVSMGLSAVFPVFHGLKIYGLSRMLQQIGLFWLVLQGVLYVVGAGLYACRFPESQWPGKFDKLGASHQIFHVFVVLAAVSHLVGLLKAFDYRHGLVGSICLPQI